MIPTHKNLPIEAGEAKYWGLPYHGLVRDGALSLPNQTNMPYPDPFGGSTVVVRNGYHLPTTRPLAQYDAAQGFVWLTFAILSGAHKQIAGVDLGGNSFIFIDHRRRPWHMEIVGLNDLWTVRVIRRFGLFGEDSISWMKNQIVHTFDPVGPTEYLDGEDISQNQDGSSVLINFRAGGMVNRRLASLKRIIELKITTVDVIPGNDGTIDFDILAEEFILTADLDRTEITQSGSQPTGNTCSSRLISAREYTPLPSLGNAWCSTVGGPGQYAIGEYDSAGNIGTVSNWDDGSWEYNYHRAEIKVVKVYYGHDNLSHLIEVRYTETIHSLETETCQSAFSSSFSFHVSVAPSGGMDGSGNPCSDYAVITWSCDRISTANFFNEKQTEYIYQGGLYYDGEKRIGWTCQGTGYIWRSSDVDGSFSADGIYTEDNINPQPPNEYFSIRDQIVSADVDDVIGVTGDSTNDGNGSGDYAFSLEFETVAYTGGGLPDNPVTLPVDNAYVIQYANNIFSLGYESFAQDPPEYFTQWSLIAEGNKIIQGEILDPSFYATVDPHWGTVTIDPDVNVCYV